MEAEGSSEMLVIVTRPHGITFQKTVLFFTYSMLKIIINTANIINITRRG